MFSPDAPESLSLQDGNVVDNIDQGVADDKSGEVPNPSTKSAVQTDDDEGRYTMQSSQHHYLAIQHVTTNSNINDNSEHNFINYIFYWIRGLFGFFYKPSSGSDEGNQRDKELFISGDEIDQLAVFQGSVIEFLELHGGQVALQKILKMEALLKNDNHSEWEQRCRQFMARPIVPNGVIQQLESFRAQLKAYIGTWNYVPEHCSENIYVCDDGLTVRRCPAVNQTNAVRSRLGVMSGIHAWDLKLSGPIGTHFSVGLATEKAPLNSTAGYVSLIGDDEGGQSWGWDVVWGNLSHKGKTIGVYPRLLTYEYTPGDIIRLVVNCDKRDMSFAVNELFFGVAFRKLPKNVHLYPTVGLVYGSVEVTLVYLGVPPPLRN